LGIWIYVECDEQETSLGNSLEYASIALVSASYRNFTKASNCCSLNTTHPCFSRSAFVERLGLQRRCDDPFQELTWGRSGDESGSTTSIVVSFVENIYKPLDLGNSRLPSTLPGRCRLQKLSWALLHGGEFIRWILVIGDAFFGAPPRGLGVRMLMTMVCGETNGGFIEQRTMLRSSRWLPLSPRHID